MRILFVGNSITWHPVKEEIGWLNEWGMAASSKENDFVHLVMDKVRMIHPDAEYKIAWAVAWEREYWDAVHLVAFREFLNFKADIIIVKINENVTADNNDQYPYSVYYRKLLGYLNPDNKARFVLCTGFWEKGLLDSIVRNIANDNGYPLVELNHLDTEDMKAHDTYGNSAPANHPGDRGMKAIADCIWAELEHLL
ncbi:MAG: hypothetical protein R3232_02450 [Clostridia bacterium]|nr:hypothetical protein [Clostridia bacterium]